MGDSFPILAKLVNTGQLSWLEFLRQVAAKTGGTVPELQRLYETELLDPDLLVYVNELHKTYKTAILTNAHHEFIDPAIGAAHLTQLFDVIVISSLTGILKPDPRSFQRVLNRLEIEPDEAVFIDDNPRHSDGAKACGLHAIVYQDITQLKTELNALLSGQSGS